MSLNNTTLSDGERLAHVRCELELLHEVLQQAGMGRDDPGWEALLRVNAELWDLENPIREFDVCKQWGQGFIDVARAIHRLNDARHSLKRDISLSLDNGLVEEKHYPLTAPGV